MANAPTASTLTSVNVLLAIWESTATSGLKNAILRRANWAPNAKTTQQLIAVTARRDSQASIVQLISMNVHLGRAATMVCAHR